MIKKLSERDKSEKTEDNKYNLNSIYYEAWMRDPDIERRKRLSEVEFDC